jgi:hypothetical protein
MTGLIESAKADCPDWVNCAIEWLSATLLYGSSWADGCRWGLAPQSGPLPICSSSIVCFARTFGTAASGQLQTFDSDAKLPRKQSVGGHEAPPQA